MLDVFFFVNLLTRTNTSTPGLDNYQGKRLRVTKDYVFIPCLSVFY